MDKILAAVSKHRIPTQTFIICLIENGAVYFCLVQGSQNTRQGASRRLKNLANLNHGGFDLVFNLTFSLGKLNTAFYRAKTDNAVIYHDVSAS